MSFFESLGAQISVLFSLLLENFSVSTSPRVDGLFNVSNYEYTPPGFRVHGTFINKIFDGVPLFPARVLKFVKEPVVIFGVYPVFQHVDHVGGRPIVL